MVFLFPDDDTLRFALTGGLIPPAVSLVPAVAGRDADGRPWVQPTGPLPRALPAVLRRVGVSATEDEPLGGREVAHWLQVLPLWRDAAPPTLTDQTPVLFELPDPAGLAALVGEMLRLGNDRQGFRIITKVTSRQRNGGSPNGVSTLSHSTSDTRHSALLRVIGPPYYSLLRALDRLGPGAPRAYVERAPRVWVEVGYTHPLVDLLRAPEGQWVLLRSPQEWVYLDDGPFRDVYEVLEFALEGEPTTWADATPADKLTVPLRLATGAGHEPAELWILAGDGVEQIDALVRDADDRLVSRLLFAVGEMGGERVAVVRARPGKGGPPVLVLDGLACRSYLRLPNLFLPVGHRLRPPLRRDAVRQLLAADPDMVTWLAPAEGDSFVPQSLPDAAFRPLADWVEYILDRDAGALTAWAQAAHFDFATFVSNDEFVVAPKSAQPRQRRPRGDRLETPSEKPPAPAVATVNKPRAKVPGGPSADAFIVRKAATPSELQQRLKETERRFLAVEGALDAPERLALWPELARLNAALQHNADAALCWANALWEPRAPAASAAWAWVQSERALPRPELTAADLDRLLGHANPALPDLRPLVAALVWAAQQKPMPAALRERLPAVQRYLERYDHLLPVRIVWLAWHGLAQLSGSDLLMLARVRDRLLQRLLAEGLGAERDLPGFLRFAGQREGDRLRTVRERAERMRQLAHEWYAQPQISKGALDQTPAYIDLLFAFGMARLGEASACQHLLRQAGTKLAESDQEAHRFLLQAFQYRIEQVLASRPHAGPLPTEQLEYLEQMHRELDPLPNDDQRKYDSYAVERMRKDSRVLEPQEEFDVYRRAQRFQDELIAEMMRLPDVADRRELGERVQALVQKAARSGRLAETRLRILAGVLPLATRVSEALAEELLLQVGPALDAVPPTERGPFLREQQALLLERALLFAAHFDRSDLAQSFASRLEGLLTVEADERALGAVASLVGQTLRSLRKLGLRDVSARLLQQVGQAALRDASLEEAKVREGRNWPTALQLLLNLAGGWLYFDDAERARPILDEARAYILRKHKGGHGERLSSDKYIALVCAYISALGHASLDEALARIDELLASGRMDPIDNSYTTRAYYSRLHLAVVEAIVLALANEDVALGPAARRWLDDDEYLVRRRIHRDTKSVLSAEC